MAEASGLKAVDWDIYLKELDDELLTTCEVSYYHYPKKGDDEEFVDIVDVMYNGYSVDSLLNGYMWNELEGDLLDLEGAEL